MTPGRLMLVAGRRPVAVRFLAAAVLGTWLTALRPLPVPDGRSHGCDRDGAAAAQEVALEPAQSGCHHVDVVCLVAAGCVTVAPALSPTRTTLSSLQIRKFGRDRGVTPIADLFQARPPTPPPNR
jgi:hypothetical protein